MGVHRKKWVLFQFSTLGSIIVNEIEGLLLCYAVHMWYLMKMRCQYKYKSKRDRNNKQCHLISELNSVEFAGMFKQLRPDDFRDGCILSTTFSSYVDYVKWKIKVQTWMWSWWTGLHQPTHESYQLRPRISSLSSSSSWMIVMFMSRFCKYNLSTVQCLTMTEEWKLESLTFLYIGSSAWSISSNK